MSPIAAPLELRVPGDKSISHRALILASLADGESRIRGILAAGDPNSTAAALRALGAAIPVLDAGELRVRGRGLRGWTQPQRNLDCGNSGTTARLLLGALAGLPLRALVTGDASLVRRPMRRVLDPLRRMGARFDELGEPGRLPLLVHGGALGPLSHRGTIASAQVKSALLLAGLTGGIAVAVSEPHLSRDHTERMLSALGVRLEVRQGGEPGTPATVALAPPAHLEPLDLDVPGDFSSAAFLIAAALLTHRAAVIRRVGVNPTRTGLLAVLARMGARVSLENRADAGGEPVADIVVEPSALAGTNVHGAEVPALIDEIPALAVIAARARGETRVEGAAELRVKESDRIAALVGNLRALGATADELPDGLVVVGGSGPLRGRIDAFDDHRIAMAFGVLGLADGCEIEMLAPGTADISYPGFWARLAELARRRAP